MDFERLQLGPLPALATGDGPPLLYLGGLLPVAGVDAALVRRSAEFSARPLAGVRRVVYVNRRTGLPRGMSFAELAAEHVQAIDALAVGPADVVGVSTGGSIAQQLAADHPGAVRRLVLIGTGCRLTAKTRRLQAQVAAHVRAGNPQRALASAAFGTDLATTIEAEDGFDLARCDRTITAPTLIVAGTRDRFYPRDVLEETQRLIPGSDLRRIPRRGHLTLMSSSRLGPLVRAFLAG